LKGAVMKKKEILERFCVLSMKVREHLSKHDRSFAADCFCERGHIENDNFFQFEELVLEFIEKAVEHEVTRQNKIPLDPKEYSNANFSHESNKRFR
jgi:hypothetical protein